MLHYTPVKHACRHIPPPTFLLQVRQTLENNTFTVGETVSDVWKIVMRITVVHQQFSFV
jgi:hypothetical protein